MGKAFELITTLATAPGAGAAFAALTGNSLTIRDSRHPIWFTSAWSGRQTTDGFIRYTSPLLHDAVVGMQFQNTTTGNNLDHEGGLQRLYAQDTLVAFGSGSAVAGEIEQSSFVVGYEDLPGVEGNFIDEAECRRRAIDVYSMPNTLTLGTSGQYTGAELINAEVDQFKANEEYALWGYNIAPTCRAVRWRAQDWGNLGVGGPGDQAKFLTTDWFARLSRTSGMPAIPVLNSSNKSSAFIDGAQAQGGADVTVTTQWVRLAPRNSGRR